MHKKSHPLSVGRWMLTSIVAAGLVACGGSDGQNPEGTAPPVVTPPGEETPSAPDAQPVALEKLSVTVDGKERTYFVYAPANVAELRENDARGVRVVISLHDNGQDGQANADRTRWSDVADAKGFVVAFPNAAGGNWNTQRQPGSADEIAFVRAMAAAVRTKYALTATIPTYLTGIGAGATMAQQIAMMAPHLATAVAGVGGVAGASTFELPASERPASAMAAWIVRAAGEPLALDEMRQIAYWSTANGTASSGTRTETELAETVSYAHPDNAVQQLKVSTLRTGRAGDGKAMSELFWNEMFDKTVRFADNTQTNGTLHANQTIASMQLVETTKALNPDGPRRWLTYVPSNYAALTAGGAKLPIIFSFHGRNGSARFQALITEWHKVAEAKGFIVVYPQGIGATWSASMEPDTRDVRFFLDLLAEMKASYAIDETRVFLNGSSMGTALTNRIAVQYPELFAAIAPCYSGHLSPANYGNAIVKTNVPLPVWQCRGVDELPTEFPGGTAGETAARNFWRETVNRNMGPFTLQVDGRRKTEIWNDGLAEYRWQLTDDIGHFWHPGQALKMWDEMLSKYRRTADGHLVRQ